MCRMCTATFFVQRAQILTIFPKIFTRPSQINVIWVYRGLLIQIKNGYRGHHYKLYNLGSLILLTCKKMLLPQICPGDFVETHFYNAEKYSSIWMWVGLGYWMDLIALFLFPQGILKNRWRVHFFPFGLPEKWLCFPTSPKCYTESI